MPSDLYELRHGGGKPPWFNAVEAGAANGGSDAKDMIALLPRFVTGWVVIGRLYRRRLVCAARCR